MRRLLALTMCAVSFGAAAQIFYPYNPDENGDGLIGVTDLQGLLANYGQEFDLVVVSSDSSAALMPIGSKESHWCFNGCAQLLGNWEVATTADYLKHLVGLEEHYGKPIIQPYASRTDRDAVWLGNGNTGLSVKSLQGFYDESGTEVSLPPLSDNIYVNGNYIYSDDAPKLKHDCWCASTSKPKVEYSICSSQSDFVECVEQKTQSGWYPLGGVQSGGSNDYTQAFWRWAE